MRWRENLLYMQSVVQNLVNENMPDTSRCVVEVVSIARAFYAAAHQGLTKYFALTRNLMP
jgi:hypothetical protein